MTASTGADRWPAEVVEAVAKALFLADGDGWKVWPDHAFMYEEQARAALAVVPPDPVIAAIRDEVASTSEQMERTIACGQPLIAEYHATNGFARIARLLADGGET